MAGTLTAQLLDEKLDENATSFKDAATAVGYGGNSHQVSCTCYVEFFGVTGCKVLLQLIKIYKANPQFSQESATICIGNLTMKL